MPPSFPAGGRREGSFDRSREAATFLGVRSCDGGVHQGFNAIAAGNADDDGSAIYGINSPGYRSWELVSVAHEAGNLNEIRAILGSPVTIKAFREGTLLFRPKTALFSSDGISFQASLAMMRRSSTCAFLATSPRKGAISTLRVTHPES